MLQIHFSEEIQDSIIQKIGEEILGIQEAIMTEKKVRNDGYDRLENMAKDLDEKLASDLIVFPLKFI